LYKPWSPGVGRGHKREKIFFSRTSKPISIKLNFACVYVQNISQYDSGERCGPWASCFGKTVVKVKFYDTEMILRDIPYIEK
jgi:hypothetical protein